MFLLIILVGLTHIVSGGLIAARFFKPTNRTELVLNAGLLAFVTFYMIPISVGWITGYMNGYVIGAGLGSAISVAIYSLVSKRGPYRSFTPRMAKVFGHRSMLEWTIWAALGIVVVFILLAGSTLPARMWDAAGYHMSNPMSWHRTGKFVFESFGGHELSEQAVSAECAPNVKAVLPFVVMLFTDATPGTSLAQFPFLLLLIVTVRALALRIGITPWLASLAALCTATIPEVFLQATEAYADLVFLSGQILIIWAIVYLWQESVSWRSILYPALGFGLLSGSKAAFLVSGGALGMLYGIVLLWKTVPIQRGRAAYWVAAGLCLTFASIAATGGAWYSHAYQQFQNPFYPYRIEVAGTIIFDAPMSPLINDNMIKSYTGFDGGEAYWNTLREVYRPPNLSNWSGGLGSAFFIIGIPGTALFLLAALWNGPQVSARRILVISGLLLVLACPTLAVARFSLFQPVLGLLSTVWLLSNLRLLFQILTTVVLVGAALYDLAMSAIAIQYRNRPAELVAFNLLSGYSRAAQLDIFPDQYSSLDYWREEVSRPGLKLGLPPHQVSVWHTYAPWSPSDILRFRNPSGMSDATQWHQELVDSGITHLYVLKSSMGFNVALSNPDLFALKVRRLDGQAGKMVDFFVPPWGEDALFELKTRSEK